MRLWLRGCFSDACDLVSFGRGVRFVLFRYRLDLRLPDACGSAESEINEAETELEMRPGASALAASMMGVSVFDSSEVGSIVPALKSRVLIAKSFSQAAEYR